MEASHKKVKVDEVLFYSGVMPKTLQDKPEGKLMARIIPGDKLKYPLEVGRADYCIFMTNKIPVSFGSVGSAKSCDIALEFANFPKKEASTISLK